MLSLGAAHCSGGCGLRGGPREGARAQRARLGPCCLALRAAGALRWSRRRNDPARACPMPRPPPAGRSGLPRRALVRLEGRLPSMRACIFSCVCPPPGLEAACVITRGLGSPSPNGLIGPRVSTFGRPRWPPAPRGRGRPSVLLVRRLPACLNPPRPPSLQPHREDPRRSGPA